MNIETLQKKLEIINAGYVLCFDWSAVNGLLRLHVNAREGRFGQSFSTTVICPEYVRPETRNSINLSFYEDECIDRLYEEMYPTLHPREKSLEHMMDGLAKFIDEQDRKQ